LIAPSAECRQYFTTRKLNAEPSRAVVGYGTSG
jgi:hypothetical protein